MHICDLEKFTENISYFIPHSLLKTLFPSLMKKQSKSISPQRKSDHGNNNKINAAGFN